MSQQKKDEPTRLTETDAKNRFLLSRLWMQKDAIAKAHYAIELGMEKYTLLIENLRVKDSEQLNKQMVVLTVI